MIIGFEKIPFGEVQNDLFTTTDGGLAFILSEPFRLRLYCSTSPAVRTMPMPSIQFSRKFHKKKHCPRKWKRRPKAMDTEDDIMMWVLYFDVRLNIFSSSCDFK